MQSHAAQEPQPQDIILETREDVLEFGEREARQMLGVSLEEAFAMLDRGELAGTIAEVEIHGIRFLLGNE